MRNNVCGPFSALLLAVGLTASACGGGGATTETAPGSDAVSSMAAPSTRTPVARTTPRTTPAGHNSADVTFVKEMIGHHAGALQMSKLAATQARSTQVTSLAARIERAQAPEIRSMSGWLRTWGEPLPHAAMGHDMASTEMAALGKARGTAFDRMWLTMMIAHHVDAVTMSRTVLRSGASADVRRLATSIINSQSAEIRELRALLARM